MSDKGKNKRIILVLLVLGFLIGFSAGYISRPRKAVEEDEWKITFHLESDFDYGNETFFNIYEKIDGEFKLMEKLIVWRSDLYESEVSPEYRYQFVANSDDSYNWYRMKNFYYLWIDGKSMEIYWDGNHREAYWEDSKFNTHYIWDIGWNDHTNLILNKVN